MDDKQLYEVSAKGLGELRVYDRLCPLCQRDNKDVKAGPYSYDVWDVIECPDCAFVYISSAPIYETLVSDIAWEKTTKIETERRKDMRKGFYNLSKSSRWRLHLLPRKNVSDMIEKFAAAGPVLDVVCGQGGQLSKLPGDYIPHGIEISQELARKASDVFAARGGSCVNASALNGIRQLPDDHFTAICMRSYLEHEAQPLEVMKESFRILKKGGVVIIKVPNYDSINRKVTGRKWVGFRYPDHLNYFTPKTLGEMAKAAGFERLKYGLTFKLPTSDNTYVVAVK